MSRTRTSFRRRESGISAVARALLSGIALLALSALGCAAQSQGRLQREETISPRLMIRRDAITYQNYAINNFTNYPNHGSGGRTRSYSAPSAAFNTSHTETEPIRANSLQDKDVESSAEQKPKQNPNTSEQNYNTFTHLKRVPEEYGLSAELLEIVASWYHLPDDLKTEILAKVRKAAP